MTKKSVIKRLEEIAEIREMRHLWAWKDPTTEATIEEYVSTVNRIQEGGGVKWSDVKSLREWVGIIWL